MHSTGLKPDSWRGVGLSQQAGERPKNQSDSLGDREQENQRPWVQRPVERTEVKLEISVGWCGGQTEAKLENSGIRPVGKTNMSRGS